MPGIPVARVVAVIAETGSGRVQVGSGYLLDATRVLTARHCTVDSRTGLAAAGLRVERASDGAAALVAVGAEAPGLDVALLAVIAAPPWGADLPDGPVAFGKVDRERAGQLEGCEAVGFPRWQAGDAGGFRDVAEVHGLIRVLEGRESQRLVLRDPVLSGVAAEGGRRWAGMSGAAVFHGGLLLGVIIEHHARQGDTALQIRPVEAVALASDADSRRLADALGISGDGVLRPVTAGQGRWRAEAAGEAALAQWGWSLDRDREGVRHWRPRARGVSTDSEQGWRFRGRTAALARIVAWLERPQPDRRVLVVTGSPGTGKSAVLGRVVTTADAAVRASLPPDDGNVKAPEGSVGCAVHAKGKTALEIAAEIARAASAGLPDRVEDFAPALRDALGLRGRRFNVIIDALDEAASPEQARAIVTKVILPMTETCADTGAQAVVGSRRTDDDGGDLLGTFGGAERLVDLDDAKFFAERDLAAYALATLQLTGHERPRNPYADDAVAAPVAARIAELSERNFLVAGLTARTRGLYDETALDPSALSFTPKVDDTMHEYLRRIPPVAAGATAPGVFAETLLTALAFAEAPGLTAGLWRTALRALGADDIPEAVLTGFAKSAAASFLVESSGENGQSASFRLFHQALNSALLRARARFASRTEDESALTRAFLDVGRETGWERAPAYLLRSLPAHAASGHLVDDLLADDDYLLHADLSRVRQVAHRAASRAARDRSRLLSDSGFGTLILAAALEPVTDGPANRAAMFSVTEALGDLGTAYRAGRWRVPYRAQWAAAEPGRKGYRHGVWAVSAVQTGNRTLLATGSHDGTVRLRDPVDGSLVRVLEGHQFAVRAVCAIQAGNRTLLATASNDGTVRLWDPASGTQARVLKSHQRRVNVSAVCAVQAGDRILLATGSVDRTVRLWDPASGTEVRVLEGHQDPVWAVCAIQAGNRILLASGDAGQTVRLWNPADSTQVRVLEGHQGGVWAVCAMQAGDRTLVATGSIDWTVRLWDPADGSLVRVLEGHQGPVWAVCAMQAEDRILLATGSDDRTVRLWDPADGRCVLTVPVHHEALAVAPLAGSLAIGITTGVIVIKFQADALS